jgi:hypothetical protein
MDGGGGPLPVDDNCGRPPSNGLGGRPRRPADGHPFRQSEGSRPPSSDGLAVRRRTSVGSSDASERPADAAVDVRMRDNPGFD